MDGAYVNSFYKRNRFFMSLVMHS